MPSINLIDLQSSKRRMHADSTPDCWSRESQWGTEVVKLLERIQSASWTIWTLPLWIGESSAVRVSNKFSANMASRNPSGSGSPAAIVMSRIAWSLRTSPSRKSHSVWF